MEIKIPSPIFTLLGVLFIPKKGATEIKLVILTTMSRKYSNSTREKLCSIIPSPDIETEIRPQLRHIAHHTVHHPVPEKHQPEEDTDNLWNKGHRAFFSGSQYSYSKRQRR